MNKLKVAEWFAGTGAFSMAMRNIGIDFELVAFSEIEKSAIKAYKAIHSVDDSLNLGSIVDIRATDLDIDIIVHGSPCQDFSRAGKMNGAEEGSGTRSSLMWEAVRTVEESNPKYVVWENVPDTLSKKNIETFNKYIGRLDEVGYNSYYEIINANKQGSAQKRKRLFVVSIRKDIDDNSFNFPECKTDFKKLGEYLENNVSEDYNVPQKIIDTLILGRTEDGGYIIKNHTKIGYLIAYDGDGIDWGFPTSKTRKGRVQKEMCHTLTTGKSLGTIQNGVARYYTPLESWRLQEFLDEDFYKAKNVGLSDTQLYKIAGNSINLKAIEPIFESLFKLKSK